MHSSDIPGREWSATTGKRSTRFSNGLITYDREIIKFPAADLAKIHAPLFAPTAQKE